MPVCTFYLILAGSIKEQIKTYSFLICSRDKNAVFDVESKKLREEFGLNKPFKELGFKDLRYAQIKSALPSFLELADKYIHGVLFTISIDNSVETVFDVNKKDAHNKLTSYSGLIDLDTLIVDNRTNN